jgi:hypothetical protein
MPIELKDVFASTMKVLWALSGREGREFSKSYADLATAIGLEPRHTHRVVKLLRDRNLVRVNPVADPGNMELLRTFKIRFLEEAIASRAHAAATRVFLLPLNLSRDLGIVNTIGDETRERELREREDKEDAEYRDRFDIARESAIKRADGKCETCGACSAQCTPFMIGDVEYASSPEHFILMCPRCEGIVETWLHGIGTRPDPGGPDRPGGEPLPIVERLSA